MPRGYSAYGTDDDDDDARESRRQDARDAHSVAAALPQPIRLSTRYESPRLPPLRCNAGRARFGAIARADVTREQGNCVKPGAN